MENRLQKISSVCVYIDDILVTGATEGEHLSNLAQVLERLESAGMRLKWEKCKFMLPSVSYLGHVISVEGLHTEEAKVKSIVEAPEPRNVAFWEWTTIMESFFLTWLQLSHLCTSYFGSTPTGNGDKSNKMPSTKSRISCTLAGSSHISTIAYLSFWDAMRPRMVWGRCCPT